MSKGKIGVSCNSIVYLKKPKPVPCDCERCRHSKKSAGVLFCVERNIISPNKKKCSKYWQTKQKKKNKK